MSSRTLSGGEQKRLALEALLRGPEQVLLLDEPDNSLDVPGKRWLEARAPRDAEDRAARLARPRAARTGGRPHRDARARRGRQHRMGARRQLRGLPRGAGGALRATRRAAPALGRAARRAQAARRDAQGEGDVQRRHGVALPGRGDAPAQVRGGRPARGAPAGARGLDAPARVAHRQARRRLRAPRAHRPHEAVRPRGLVRRPGRGARLERLGQVALPAAARRRRHRARPHPRARHDGGRDARARAARRARGARRARRARLVRAEPRAPRVPRAHAARHPASR